ncbi:MAG TPA: gamma-glutamylcyclotransferase family protein [Ilumatobacter sp.]|nr:gamma-glutamylcyclotransferase family protein [Ilumatobacter sp.]
MGDGAAGRWIFGYGSLVSPVSFGVTLGRSLTVGEDFHNTVLDGYGRRWNYGSRYRTGWLNGAEYSIVALGVVAAVGETVNGVIGWVTDEELVRLDAREVDYDRVDVTELIDSPAALDAPVETYVPRPESIVRYESARDAGTAAIEQRYWDLVAGAFAGFGRAARQRFLDTTPPPDVPVLELTRPDPYT